ncbi:hypothetical protein BTA51_26160 [Hahella sp. CCB-MM4]|uniref:hypothetical protein n=1 Tax=Hahella sp. (strain CCB-MM4) TaxID=1926491 RepID=UPI000B9A9B46|nr:hypothetical protein [Hahella sp. CCB-MM4]OZG70455.1 hypothetical protein BTA51_26160 [Hahella sp. CCB-MM4]
MPYNPSTHGSFDKYLVSNLNEAMKEYALVIEPTLSVQGGTQPGIKNMTFDPPGGKGNIAVLREKKVGDQTSFKCFYLPWKTKSTTSCTLNGDTDACLFFTSTLNGCRLSVKYHDGSKKSVTVLHIAGNLEKQVVGKWGTSNKTGTFARDIDQKALIGNGPNTRKFSITDKEEKDYTRDRAAFIIGIRTPSGEWKFYTQVFKDLFMGSFDDKIVEIFVPKKPILQ